MCGFAGVFRFCDKANGNSDRDWIDLHLRNSRHRGPDETKIFSRGHVLLGFNRLAIREVSSLGSQPFTTLSGNTVLCYNGETYNTKELLEKAEISEDTLKGESDTEVVAEVIEKKGLKWFAKYSDGIYALAVYCKTKGTVQLARDYLGVKPLYYGINNECLVFSSEYNGVVGHPDIFNEEINISSIINYFRFGYIQEGEGLIRGTYFLPQKSILTVNHIGEYYVKEYDDGLDYFHNKNSDLTLEEIVVKSVKEQLVSDVPIGTFLSGGVDSSIVTSISREINPNLKSYTIGVVDEYLDESKAAKTLAGCIGLGEDHHISMVNSKEVVEVIRDYTKSLGEPLADISSLLTLKVSEIAKKNVTVILSGDGGDELFWGYSRFSRALDKRSIFESNKIFRACKILLSRLSDNKLSWSLLDYNSWEEFYLNKQGITGNRRGIQLLFGKKIKLEEPLHFYSLVKQGLGEEFARSLETRIHMQRILLKVDRASMFHSLEVRVPLLSKRVFAKSMSLKAEDCIKKNQNKVPLKDIAIKRLGITAKEILLGSKKGFEPPMKDWLCNSLKGEVSHILFNPPKILKDVIIQEGVEQIWEEHQSGIRNNADVIWAIYTLFIWIDTYLAKDNYKFQKELIKN